ncbi:unnamed protein product [Arctogadus glacialis]
MEFCRLKDITLSVCCVSLVETSVSLVETSVGLNGTSVSLNGTSVSLNGTSAPSGESCCCASRTLTPSGRPLTLQRSPQERPPQHPDEAGPPGIEPAAFLEVLRALENHMTAYCMRMTSDPNTVSTSWEGGGDDTEGREGPTPNRGTEHPGIRIPRSEPITR